MLWNPQLEISALILVIIFLFFFRLQRYIPVLGNMIYHLLLVTNLGLIVIDLLASYVSTYYWKYPKWLTMGSNIVYYMLLFLLFHLFDLYARVVAYEREGRVFSKWKYINFPLYFLMFLLITNPWTEIFFTMDGINGFARTRGFYYIITPFLFYHMFAALFVITFKGKKISRKEKFSLYFFTFISLTGVFVQTYILPYYLLVNVCFSFGIGVIFMSMQNPEYDFDSRAGVYNQDSLERFLKELIYENRKFSILGVGIANYKNIKSIYGDTKTRFLLHQIGVFFNNSLKNVFCFYISNGRYVMLMTERTDKIKVKRKVENRFEKEWYLTSNRKESIHLNSRFVFLPEEAIVDDTALMIELLKLEIGEIQKSEDTVLQSINKNDVDRRAKEREYIRALHDAIEKENIEAYFQPIYDAKEKRIKGAEALARIQDKSLGIVEPDRFIPLAEEDGTILKLGEQIFRKVCKFISENDIDKLGLEYINVNLSSIQCLHLSLSDDLIAICDEYNVDMSKIHFEITETAIVDLDELNILMHNLIRKGSTFSLDDYGTGYSNLSSIIKLPFDVIKIDKSLVWSYFNKEDQMLPYLINMISENGFKVLCEGIETEEMKENVEKMGTYYEQGYYFSRPLSAESFIKLLK